MEMEESRRPPGKSSRVPGRLLLLALGSALFGSCGENETGQAPAAPAPPTPDFIVAGYMNDPVAVQRGRDLFLGSCVDFCHGLIEEDPELVDALFLFDCQWTHAQDNAEIFRVIKEGIPDTRMVGFGENFPEGDSDVWKLIAYIRQSQDNC